MSQKHPVETVKECEDKAKNIIEEARLEARETLKQALLKQGAENEKLLEKESSLAAQILRKAVDKIEKISEDKEKEIRIQGEFIIDKAAKRQPEALGLIMRHWRGQA